MQSKSSMEKNICVLTGDIIGSRKVDATLWSPVLEGSVAVYSKKFDIFRGDSFQALISMEDAFKSAFFIKASLLGLKDLDMRIGIGIGELDLHKLPIKQASGSALIYSGEAFDSLKKETIRVKSAYEAFDQLCNTMLPLAAELMSRLTPNMAKTVAMALQNEEASQDELALLLTKSYQSQVSTELNKASYFKIKRAIDYCTQELLAL